MADRPTSRFFELHPSVKEMFFSPPLRTYERVTLTVDPGRCERVWKAEFSTFGHLFGSTSLLPLSEAEYVRMSRSLMLLRLQDVHRHDHYLPPEDKLTIPDRGFLIPGSSAELLQALGVYDSAFDGGVYLPTYPKKPKSDPPDWYRVSFTDWSSYSRLMSMLGSRVKLARFPGAGQREGRPLHHYVPVTTGDVTQVTAAFNPVSPDDALLRLVWEDFYTDNPFASRDLALIASSQVNAPDFTFEYVRSHLLRRV